MHETSDVGLLEGRRSRQERNKNDGEWIMYHALHVCLQRA
jgi:hypothetical protein